MTDFHISLANGLKISEIQTLSSIHSSSISHSRFATLPTRVQYGLYTHCLNSKKYSIFVARDNGGILIGGALVEDQNAADSPLILFLMRKFPLQVISAVLRHPLKWLLQTIVEAVLTSRTNTERFLSAIYVSKNQQSQGLGSQLLSEVELAGPLGIVTEFRNDTALKFYKKNHYMVRKSFLNSCYLAKSI